MSLPTVIVLFDNHKPLAVHGLVAPELAGELVAALHFGFKKFCFSIRGWMLVFSHFAKDYSHFAKKLANA